MGLNPVRDRISSLDFPPSPVVNRWRFHCLSRIAGAHAARTNIVGVITSPLAEAPQLAVGKGADAVDHDQNGVYGDSNPLALLEEPGPRTFTAKVK